jgi:hypothetical protein
MYIGLSCRRRACWCCLGWRGAWRGCGTTTSSSTSPSSSTPRRYTKVPLSLKYEEIYPGASCSAQSRLLGAVYGGRDAELGVWCRAARLAGLTDGEGAGLTHSLPPFLAPYQNAEAVVHCVRTLSARLSRRVASMACLPRLSAPPECAAPQRRGGRAGRSSTCACRRCRTTAWRRPATRTSSCWCHSPRASPTRTRCARRAAPPSSSASSATRYGGPAFAGLGEIGAVCPECPYI